MRKLALVLWVLLCLPAIANAQNNGIWFLNANGGRTIVGTSNPLPVSATVTATVTFPTIGAAVPSTGIYNGINVAGTLRGITGLGLGSTFSQTVAIVDASGNQITSFGSSASVGATGAAVPASANYIGINVAGTLTGWTGAVTNAGTFATQATLANETTKVIGTVNQGTSPWVVSGSLTGAITIADGADVTQGAVADTAYAGSGNATVVSALKGIYASVNSAIPAGTAIIGNVRIDQTTPGTTNAVAFTNTTLAVTNAGTFAVQAAQSTAANLNATVVGTGTFVTQATLAAETTKVIGVVGSTGPYPSGATPYTATATGTTGATTATLTGAMSLTTYICGFSIRANATAAATGNATVTGTITGTLNFTQWTAPNASGLGIAEMIFAPCVPASTTNTDIAVVSAAPGTGGVVSVTAWGYKL